MSGMSLAYPVQNPHGLSLNTEYLADLRKGLERANVYRHHLELWPSVDDDMVAVNDPVSLDGPQPPPCRNLTLAGGLNIGLRCHSRAVQILGYDDRGKHPLWWGNNFSFVPPLWNS